jgi:hypothetical protein
MAKRLQHRGGTTSQHSSFTGAVREVTVDTDKNTLVVHDGATAGGHPLATATNFKSTGIDDNATSTAITIDSNERLGVGTTSPDAKLEIQTGSDWGNIINSTNAGTQYLQQFEYNGSSIGKIRGDNSSISIQSGSNLILQTANVERMRIDSSGDVQIGSTNSGVGGVIDLSIGNTSSSGGITLWCTSGSAHSIGFGDGYTGTDRYRGYLEYIHSSDSMRFGTSATEAMRIDSSGAVSIATTSASNGEKLKVQGKIYINAAESDSIFTTGACLIFPQTYNNIRQSTDHSLVFDAWNNGNVNSPLTIKQDGKIGIGTSSPSATLHVDTSNTNVTPDSSADDLFIENSDTGGITIGSGTSGTGTIYFGDSGDNSAGRLNYYHSDNSMRMFTAGAERMRINSSGQTLIGTTVAPDNANTKLMVHTPISSSSLNVIEMSHNTNGANKAGAALGLSIGNGGEATNAASLLFKTASGGSLGERMRISPTGNVGILNSAPTVPLEVNGIVRVNQASGVSNGAIIIDALATGNPNLAFQQAGVYKGYIHYIDASDTICLNDGSGNGLHYSPTLQRLGIGTNSPDSPLDILTSGNSGLEVNTGTSSAHRIYLGNTGGTSVVGTLSNHNFGVITNASERMNISHAGGTTFNAANGGGVAIHLKHNEATQPYGMLINFTAAAPDNNTNYYLKGVDSTADRFLIWSDGDLDNHDNSYGAISDERIKQDIVDSNSQWEDIKAVRVRNFKKKDDVRQYGENAKTQIGVVAQELETVSPSLIKHKEPSKSDILSDSSFGTLYQEGDIIPEGKEIGDVKEINEQVKKVSYSVLYMKAIKALQEAMERIETLEAKVQTLENNQP